MILHSESFQHASPKNTVMRDHDSMLLCCYVFVPSLCLSLILSFSLYFILKHVCTVRFISHILGQLCADVPFPLIWWVWILSSPSSGVLLPPQCA